MPSKTPTELSKLRGCSSADRPPESTSDLILRAAAALFRERGYEGTKVDDVGSAVGLTGPAIYRHFSSKEHLLVAVIEREFDLFEERLRAEVVDTQSSPTAALERYVRLAVSTVLEDRGVVSALPGYLRSLPPDVERRLTDRHHRIVHRWAKVLRAVRPELSAYEAQAITVVVSSLINSVALENIRLESDNLRTRVERMAMAAFLSG